MQDYVCPDLWRMVDGIVKASGARRKGAANGISPEACRQLLTLAKVRVEQQGRDSWGMLHSGLQHEMHGQEGWVAGREWGLSAARLHAWRLPQRAAGWATVGSAPNQACMEGTTKGQEGWVASCEWGQEGWVASSEWVQDG